MTSIRFVWAERTFAAVGTATLLVACGGSSDAPTVQTAASSTSTPTTSSAPTSPVPSPSSSSSSSTAGHGITATIKTGQCIIDTETYAIVPCTQAHFYQVTAVIKDARETGNTTARQVLRRETCNASLTKFSGGAPVGLLALGSPVALVDDPLNASRIVCLMRLRTDGDTSNRLIDFSLENKLVGSAALKYTFCVDKVKGFNVVKCSAAHGGQTTGGYLVGKYVEKFPGKARLASLRDQNCSKLGAAFLGTASRRDIRSTGLPVTESAWAQGDRYAACFVQVTSGTVSTSLQGIGTKALTSYR